MNCTSVFKLKSPKKVNLFLKVLLVFYFIIIIIIIFVKKQKRPHNGYIPGTLFVCWSSMVECTCGQIAILV